MTPAQIIDQAVADGVSIALSAAGTLTAKGDQAAVDRWLPTIRDNKPGILCELERESRREKVLEMLEAAPGIRYAVYVADASTDPVVVAVGIRKIATFEMEIPYQYYDGFTLQELLEKHSACATTP